MQTKCVSRVQLESSSLIQLRIKEMVVVDKLLCGNSVSLSVLFFFLLFHIGSSEKKWRKRQDLRPHRCRDNSAPRQDTLTFKRNARANIFRTLNPRVSTNRNCDNEIIVLITTAEGFYFGPRKAVMISIKIRDRT